MKTANLKGYLGQWIWESKLSFSELTLETEANFIIHREFEVQVPINTLLFDPKEIHGEKAKHIFFDKKLMALRAQREHVLQKAEALDDEIKKMLALPSPSRVVQDDDFFF